MSAITGPPSGKVTQGRNATFTAIVTGAFDTSITWSSAGAGSWSGNTWAAPSTPGSYTITATAVNGATNTLPITVVIAPAICAFSASPVGINKNQSSTLTASFTGTGTGSNASGVVTPGNLALTTGGAGISTGALTTTTLYTLTVTNDAGDSATAQTTVQVFLGSFSATANSLSPARDLPTVMLRPNGNVLVAGGGNASSAADIFNGTALTFLANSSDLLSACIGSTSTLLPNGLILLAGGSNGTAILASAELYNPATGSFTATGSLQQARRIYRAVLLDTGKVLPIGGTSLNSAEIYDPLTGSFTLISPMSSPRDSATVARLPDGRVLITGGLSGSTRLASAEIFDPSTNTFSTAANMLQARALHTATVLPGGQVLIAGGTGGSGSGSAELFTTSLLKFVATGNMIQPRQEHVATLLAGGMVLIAGGNSGTTPAAIDQAELFDPAQGSFLKTDFMSTTGTPTTGTAATLLSSGKVLVTGGTSNGSTVVPGSELYTSTDGLSAAAADATLTAPTYVVQGATSVAAHATAVANAHYIWMVSNGTLTSGQGTPSSTLNMPASGSATLDLLIVRDRLVPSHGSAVITGDPAPTIGSFTAASTPVLYGVSTTDGSTPRLSADLFNPIDTSFTATGNMGTPRSGPGSALLPDGTVLVSGGTSDGTTPLASAERFDPQDSLTPFRPDATIVPSVTHAMLGAAGLTATTPSQAGNHYVWFIRNGAIASGQGASTVTSACQIQATLCSTSSSSAITWCPHTARSRSCPIRSRSSPALPHRSIQYPSAAPPRSHLSSAMRPVFSSAAPTTAAQTLHSRRTRCSPSPSARSPPQPLSPDPSRGGR